LTPAGRTRANSLTGPFGGVDILTFSGLLNTFALAFQGFRQLARLLLFAYYF
jgi:hypothetical protein